MKVPSLIQASANLLLSFSVLAGEVETRSGIMPLEMSLAATERILERDLDLKQRVNVLIRWMSLQYEFHSQDPSKAENLIFERLTSEIIKMEEIEVSSELDPLYRQVAWHQAALKKWNQAIQYLLKMRHRDAKDEIVLGDAYLATGLSSLALEAFERAKFDLPAISAYKTAWAYLQLHQYQKALSSFDEALAAPVNEETGSIRAEAFRERMIPFVELFKKADFNTEDASHLKRLAQSAFPVGLNQAQIEFEKALQSGVEGFLGRAETKLARAAYNQLLLNSPIQTEFFLKTSPLWLRVYRSKLEYLELENILRDLPSTSLSEVTHSHLLQELIKTSDFFEAIHTGSRDDETRRMNSAKFLAVIYDKSLRLFPESKALANQRMNAAKLALDQGNHNLCLEYLNGQEVGNIQASCRLRRIDHMIAEKIDDQLPQELGKALVEDRLYARFSDERAFQIFIDLTKILMGQISKNQSNEYLRSVLVKLLDAYPFDRKSKNYKLLKEQSDQLRFLELSKEGVVVEEDRGEEFYKLFLGSDPKSDLALKSLQNSILLSSGQSLAIRCDQFINLTKSKIDAANKVWHKCFVGAEEDLDLKRMSSLLALVQKTLSHDQKEKFRLVLLALGKKISDSKLIQRWESIDKPVSRNKASQEFKSFTAMAQSLEAKLLPVSLKTMGRVLSQRVKTWEKLDLAMKNFYEVSTNSDEAAKILLLRSSASRKILSWIRSLPRPLYKSVSEGQKYEEEFQRVIDVWTKNFEERRDQCGAAAYWISPEFNAKEVDLCPESVAKEVFEAHMKEWRAAQPQTDSTMDPSSRGLKILKAAEKMTDKLQARYWLMVAKEELKTPAAKAMVYLALSKNTSQTRYLIEAIKLNVYSENILAEGVLTLKVNSFHLRLMNQKLTEIRRGSLGALTLDEGGGL